ncbi:MAG: DUF305 domain-containing protein [Desulfobacterales bacterium]|nr:DUF305 domain-containing protein [Desulfobacterales bacterium]
MNSNYTKLGLVLIINTIVMFILTYSLISDLTHFYPNINRFYMALMMAAPMAILMLLVMRAMYQNARLNAILITVFSLFFIIVFLLARTQTLVRDEQFLRSMIPHHSSAILMCEQAQISDSELSDLCDDIIQAQKREISQMKEILKRY